MSIVASVIIADQAQADGRRYVRWRHTDHLGVQREITILVAANADASSMMAAQAAALPDELKLAEFQSNLAAIYVAGPLAVLVFNHSTAAEERVMFRAMYKTLVREQAFAVGAFLQTLSDAQLANIFQVANPSAALNALKARLATKATQWSDYLASVGE